MERGERRDGESKSALNGFHIGFTTKERREGSAKRDTVDFSICLLCAGVSRIYHKKEKAAKSQECLKVRDFSRLLRRN